jgi:hypothetical protein
MHANEPALPPSWKSLLFFALLFAFPLAFAQGGILFLGTLTQTSLAFGVWFCGTSVCFFLAGGLCTLVITRGLDEFTATKLSRQSSLLTGFLSSLLWFIGFALYLIWYINWWIPRLSTQRSGGHVIPGSGMSPQEAAKFGLLFLPFEMIVFFVGNLWFIFLALMGAMLINALRARYMPIISAHK